MDTWLGLLVGGAALLAGAELLVKGASRLAVSVGISPLVVGLTVVAFGTSAPEVAVTVGASFSGEVDIALGNVVGSNIANVLLILGLSALVGPLVVEQRLVRFEVRRSSLPAIASPAGKAGYFSPILRRTRSFSSWRRPGTRRSPPWRPLWATLRCR